MTERKEFEKWISQDGTRPQPVAKKPDGEYVNAGTEYAWLGWQAARAQLLVKITELEEENVGYINWINELRAKITELEEQLRNAREAL